MFENRNNSENLNNGMSISLCVLDMIKAAHVQKLFVQLYIKCIVQVPNSINI